MLHSQPAEFEYSDEDIERQCAIADAEHEHHERWLYLVTSHHEEPSPRANDAPPAAPANTAGDRPAVQVSADLHSVVDAGISLLASDPDMFQRDGELVRVVRIAATDDEAKMGIGTPVIRKVQAATLAKRLTYLADWVRENAKGNLVPCQPPDKVISAILANSEYPCPPIVGIAEAPLLRPDGTILETPGYDSSTGYFYAPSAEFPKIPDNPTKQDAVNALERLNEVWIDFPFRSDADRMLPIALLLTVLARPAIPGNTPAFIFDANTRGSGKTRQAEAACLIATGRDFPKMNYPSHEDELEKVLAAVAMRGMALLGFDNVSQDVVFGGGALDRILTSRDRVQLRVLGKSEAPDFKWRTVVFATGNNVQVTGDTVSRVLVGRMESPLEHPEDRKGFKHPDLISWVAAERPRLVVDALTILRAWVLAGRPRVARWGRFEEWCDIVPSAIVFAGGANSIDIRCRDESDDPKSRVLLALFPYLANRTMTASDIHKDLYNPTGKSDGLLEREDHRDELRDALAIAIPTFGKPISAIQIGKLFGKIRDRVIDNRKLTGIQDRNKTVQWQVKDVGNR